MKIKSEICNLRGSRAVRYKAIIQKSAKLGIKKRFQKTWSFPTVAPEYTLQEMRPSIEAEAVRWEKKVLAKLNGAAEAEQPKQSEITPTPPALAGLQESSLLPTPPAA